MHLFNEDLEENLEWDANGLEGVSIQGLAATTEVLPLTVRTPIVEGAI